MLQHARLPEQTAIPPRPAIPDGVAEGRQHAQTEGPVRSDVLVALISARTQDAPCLVLKLPLTPDAERSTSDHRQVVRRLTRADDDTSQSFLQQVVPADVRRVHRVLLVQPSPWNADFLDGRSGER